MRAEYHRQITEEALRGFFSSRALRIITRSNLSQDSIVGQLFHNEFHFDNNKIMEGFSYIKKQKETVVASILSNEVENSWRAFGRLTHSLQDFFAHSNYVKLWFDVKKNSQNDIDNIPTDCPEIINHPTFHSHTVYFPLDIFGLILGSSRLIYKFLPEDSHTKMNLDSPESGKLFKIAFYLAKTRTLQEFINIKRIIENINPGKLAFFLDLDQE